MEQPNFIELLFCFTFWLFIVYNCRKQISNPYINNGYTYFVFGFLAILFNVFAFNRGDFYHYNLLYHYNLNSPIPIHVEYIYYWLIKILPGGYYTWRLFVWGTAIIIWLSALKRMKLKSQNAALIMTIVLLVYFPNMRQSLAFSIMYYSLTHVLFPIKQHRIISYIIASLGLYLCVFFHKSMFAYLVLLLLILMPFNKTVITVSIILFPILYSVIMSYVGDFITATTTNEQSIDGGFYYLESERSTKITIWGWINIIVTRAPIVLSIWYFLKQIYYKGGIVIDKRFLPFLKYTYILMYIGFLFFQQETSAFLSARFLDATFYPLSIFLTYYICTQLRTRTIKSILYLFIISQLYQFLYSLYKNF